MYAKSQRAQLCAFELMRVNPAGVDATSAVGFGDTSP